MKRIRDCSNEELNSFESLVSPLVKYVKKHWNTRSFKPKGYKAFIDEYEDYAGMEELDTSDFKGLIDGTAGSYEFPVNVSLPHVAYSDRGQGRDPLTSLMSACVAYGMAVQEQRDKTKEKSILDFLKMIKTGDYDIYLNEYGIGKTKK